MKIEKLMPCVCLTLLSCAALGIAQTGVTTSGTTTVGTVPVFGPSSNATVTNSPITASAGNVGIGTTGPTSILQVQGSLNNQWVGYFTNTNANGAGLYVYSGNNNGAQQVFQIDSAAKSGIISAWSNGTVGIGTTSPQAPLDVAGTQIQLSDPSQALSNYSYIKTSAYTFNTQKLTLGTTYGYAVPVDALTVFDGNVGIGTTSPGAKLEVDGSVKLTSGSGASVTYADGTTQSTAWTGVLCGGDYAEAVNASGGKTRYEPGDVLVLTSDDKGDVQKSSQPYSTLVAGIYATKPGVVGRRQNLVRDSDDVPMAMIGIVPTKVSTENGPIRKGDLLVTSSIPGFAMKGTDRNRLVGAVIGKAMGSLDSGNGVIQVLVTLQ